MVHADTVVSWAYRYALGVAKKEFEIPAVKPFLVLKAFLFF